MHSRFDQDSRRGEEVSGGFLARFWWEFAMHVCEFNLFPTRLLAIQFPDVDDLNQELHNLFVTREEFHDGFNMHPDSLNLLHLANTCGGIARLRGMFLEGVKLWLESEKIHGDLHIDMVLFSNKARKGEFTLVHNHSADLVGVYYVRTAQSDRPAVSLPEPDGDYDYFAAEDGALILHDPRFNANLAALQTRDYAKVFPRPGLMVVFPGYLWHSVTPHLGEQHRLAISGNFHLRWNIPSKAESYPVSIAKS
jgi:hypothetical protein